MFYGESNTPKCVVVFFFLHIGPEQSYVFNEAYGSQTHQFSTSEDDDYAENSSKIQG